MMNAVWLFLVVVSLITGAFTGQMGAVTNASIEWAGKAVTIALGLIGMMAFWLGMMRVARDAGMLQLLARGLRPIMVRLFPEVPADHPAMSAMILNMGANMMGLTNAATPFGIKAVEELDRLNPRKGTATNPMCLFLAINTSAVALFPSGVIAIRASIGSGEPAGIIATTLVATSISTLVAIVSAKLLQRLPRFRATDPGTLAVTGAVADVAAEADSADPDSVAAQAAAARARASRTRLQRAGVAITLTGIVLAVAGSAAWRWAHPLPSPASSAETTAGSVTAEAEPVARVTRHLAEKGLLELVGDVASAWFLPVLMVILALYGWARGVKVYESLVEGAREGFQVALRIIPYLVAILVAVGMFQASGALDLLVGWISPVTSTLGMPAEALPSALLRPLSGSGSFGVMTHALEAYGPDSYLGYLVSTVQGSTETTFYVLAVYFGAVGIRRVRHALPACLLADAAGMAGAVVAVNLLTGL